MLNRKNRLKIKWPTTILVILVLTFLAIPCVYAQEYKLGDIPLHPEKYKKHLKVWPMEMAEMLPVYYDARDYGLVTPAKNQSSCGSCWAFASVGAMESHMLKAYQAGPEDLSEQQQVSCNIDMYGCSGGNSTAIRYWEATGPLDEDCFPYTAFDSTPCSEESCSQLGYRVIDWHTVGTNDFKNSLYTYGPSYWRYTVYNDFFTFWNTYNPGAVYVNQSNDYAGGHAVLLIGWDDSKQAYLCKNSWGSGGPNGDGTFWIAYSGHQNNLGFGMANFSLTALACSSDQECDDGVYCNGEETCVGGTCQDGTPDECQDDKLFCNGSEVCDEVSHGCGSTGNPCESGFECDEALDQCVSLCGNGVCDAGENCNSCPNDCISGSGGGTPEACWKYDGICHPKKENTNCADCNPGFCCGNGVCEKGEGIENCGIDCPPTTCGDGSCDPGENMCTCPDDCGGPLSSEVDACDDGVDNDCDGFPDCSDIDDCKNDPACGPSPTCVEKGVQCVPDKECCSGKCHPVKNVCM